MAIDRMRTIGEIVRVFATSRAVKDAGVALEQIALACFARIPTRRGLPEGVTAPLIAAKCVESLERRQRGDEPIAGRPIADYVVTTFGRFARGQVELFAPSNKCAATGVAFGIDAVRSMVSVEARAGTNATQVVRREGAFTAQRPNFGSGPANSSSPPERIERARERQGRGERGLEELAVNTHERHGPTSARLLFARASGR